MPPADWCICVCAYHQHRETKYGLGLEKRSRISPKTSKGIGSVRGLIPGFVLSATQSLSRLRRLFRKVCNLLKLPIHNGLIDHHKMFLFWRESRRRSPVKCQQTLRQLASCAVVRLWLEVILPKITQDLPRGRSRLRKIQAMKRQGDCCK